MWCCADKSTKQQLGRSRSHCRLQILSTPVFLFSFRRRLIPTFSQCSFRTTWDLYERMSMIHMMHWLQSLIKRASLIIFTWRQSFGYRYCLGTWINLRGQLRNRSCLSSYRIVKIVESIIVCWAMEMRRVSATSVVTASSFVSSYITSRMNEWMNE